MRNLLKNTVFTHISFAAGLLLLASAIVTCNKTDDALVQAMNNYIEQDIKTRESVNKLEQYLNNKEQMRSNSE